MGKLVLDKEVEASLLVGIDQLKRRLVPSRSVGVDQFRKEGCFLQNQLVLVN